MSDKQKSVEKMKDLVCLLPAGMAGGFGQCLQLLEGLLQQAHAATVQVQEVVDSDSEMGAATPSHVHMHVPLFPRGDKPPHAESEDSSAESPSATDPHMAPTAEGCKTPPRARARSADPERSPVTRSRSHSLFRKCCIQEHFSRRESMPTSL